MRVEAFTLSEVLITLGIIGVVAALTMPALLSNVNDKIFENANKVFRSKFEQTAELLNVKQKMTSYATTEDFVKELQKNMKIVKTCDNTKLNECFSETFDLDGTEIKSADLKTSSNFGLSEWGTNIIGFILADGTNALITYNKNCIPADEFSNNPSETTKCTALLYDINGVKKPNKYHKDVQTYGNVTISSNQKKLPQDIGFPGYTFVWTDDTYTKFDSTDKYYYNCKWIEEDTYFICTGRYCSKPGSTWQCESTSHSGGAIG